MASRHNRLLGAFVACLSALHAGTALCQSTPPWQTPGHPHNGSPLRYARGIYDRYRANADELKRARGELAGVRDQLSPYRGTGLFGGAAIGFNDPQAPVQQAELTRRIAELEAVRGDLEREWEEWCHWGLTLGPLSDANEEIDDPYLDNSTFPPQIKYRKMDRIAFRLRYLAEKADPPKGVFPPDYVGTVHCAGGASVAQARPAGTLKAGQQIMSQGGSFPGKEDEADITVGPFPIPAACKIRAHVVGNPPVPGVWSLYNSNTGMTVVYQRDLGSRLGAGENVIGLGGQMENNDLTGEADLPGPGQITVVFGHPRGSGPLFGGNFAQGFNGQVTCVEVPADVPAVGGARLHHGDRLRTGGQPGLIVLPDGTYVNLEPNSEVTFTRTGPGVVRVNLERGRARILKWGLKGPHGGCEAYVRGRAVRPKGTDLILSDTGDSGSVGVLEGSVVVSGEPGEVTVEAGRQLALPSGALTDFDVSGVRPVLVNGLPVGEQSGSSSAPEPFGEVAATFTGGLTDGWLLEDPDADCKIEPLGGGALRVTVPELNDLWEGRYGAPRLLHKVTGDFDLQAELTLASEATDCVIANFLVKSPGCYMGFHERQMPLDGTGADYWVTALCRAKGWGALDKLPLWNEPSYTRWPDAPAGPVHVRYLRRDNVWRAYWSADGQRWNLCYTSDAALPDTVWVGWVLKRWAWDGLRDKPGIFTLRNVRLRTAALGTLDLPEWDLIAENAEAVAKGRNVQLTVNGGARSSARAYTGSWLTGDFDISASYDAGAWTHQPGQTRWWGLWATTDDEKNRFYVCGEAHPGSETPWIGSDLCLDGGWRGYQRANVDLHAGKFRITRQDGLLCTYYWDKGAWVPLGKWDQKLTVPLRVLFWAHNAAEVQVFPSFAAGFTVEDVKLGRAYPPDGPPSGTKPPGGQEPAGQTPFVAGQSTSGMMVGVEVQEGKLVGQAETFDQPTRLAALFPFKDLPAGTQCVCLWLRDGQEVGRSNVDLEGTGKAWFTTSTTREGGFEPGNYEAQATVGGETIAAYTFRVGTPTTGQTAATQPPATTEADGDQGLASIPVVALNGPTFSQPLGAEYPTGDFQFVFQVNYREPGTIVDTVGINGAPVGSFSLRVAGDGTVSFAVYDPGSQSEVRDRNGWHTLSVPQALEARKAARVAVERKGDEITLSVGPATARKTATAELATPLSGEPAYLGDFPGDEHWGAGFNIHQGMTGSLKVVRFGG